MPATPKNRRLGDDEVERYRPLDELAGLSWRGISPKAQVATGAGIAGLILLATVYLWLLVFDAMFPIGEAVTIYGLCFASGLALPAAWRLLRQGVAELRGQEPDRHRAMSPKESATALAKPSGKEKHAERQLLEAIERYGEITPARVALETTLTVDEADQMLSDLAKKGHIEVRVEEGRLVYGL